MLATVLFALAVTTTDQTIQVQKGTRLEVANFAGEVAVTAWDKDAVRVQVNHSDREQIDIRPADQVLTIRSHMLRGAPRSLDYTITVPRWMAISISGTYTDATLTGVGAEVTIETTRGDIKVSGGSGVVTLKSVSGDISLEKAKGRVDVRTVNESIHLADISGDVAAETTNGSIVVDRVDSANVDLYTVNGDISYDGPIHDQGVYRLTTHNGAIGIAVPDKVNATIVVRTYNGGFKSTFPVKLDDQNPRKRFTLTLGGGSARIELESFGGTIALRRPGEPRAELERERRRHEHDKEKYKEKEKDRGAFDMLDMPIDVDIEDAIGGALEGVQDQLDAIVDAAVHSVPHPLPVPRVRIPRP